MLRALLIIARLIGLGSSPIAWRTISGWLPNCLRTHTGRVATKIVTPARIVGLPDPRVSHKALKGSGNDLVRSTMARVGREV